MEMEKTNQLLWKADLENGMYQNPILHADYSDPDVIRVRDTYYMTASSFNYIPGLPILISKDLVNWELKNYAAKQLPYSWYDKPMHAKGIWAPSIRYHKGEFWIFVGMPDEGIFMTKTKDPLGEWSPLLCIWEGKGFIDTCPYWEEDGKAYIIHAYANSRIGLKSKLGIMEMLPDGSKCISEDKFIFDGTETQPTIEGPKVYKRDGYYYIFAPAGGVKTGWQTVLRSRFMDGPYEEKIVMHQGNAKTNGPHQGGLVDTVNGAEWFVHFQDKGVYGRIVHLQPVTWKNGWPVIGVDVQGKGIGEPVDTYEKPNGVQVTPHEPVTSDDFSGNQLGLQWQWMANAKDSFYSLSEKTENLCLYPLNTTEEEKAILWNSANVLTQKIVCPSFLAKTKLDFSKLSKGDKAGVIVIGGQYAALYVKRIETGFQIGYMESYGDGETRQETIVSEEEWKSEKMEIDFNIQFYEEGTSTFQYETEDREWSEPTKRFSPKGAVWVGAKIGLFAVSDLPKEAAGKAFFEYFHVIAL